MSAATARTLLQILASVETLSGIYFRDDLFRALAARSIAHLRGRTAILYRVTPGASGYGVIPLGWCVAEGNEPHWEEFFEAEATLPADPFIGECLAAGDALRVDGSDDGWRLICILSTEDRARLVLEVHTPYPLSSLILEGMRHFLHCFENLLRQWEYANLDTLTRLLNRKTFDEQFDKLILEAEKAQRRSNERRGDDFRGNRPSWLGVVDIDHFKRVNDGFGHLFGDEVLLLVAQLMKHAFRDCDKLFRFGGEEFVVMLRNVSEDAVSGIFERFRQTVEVHDFPQVGQVTVSLGYARIDPAFTPAELLGRADEALYFAKQHGRNQVRGFDDLVMQGHLHLVTPGGGEAQADADIFFS